MPAARARCRRLKRGGALTVHWCGARTKCVDNAKTNRLGNCSLIKPSSSCANEAGLESLGSVKGEYCKRSRFTRWNEPVQPNAQVISVFSVSLFSKTQKS